MAVRTPSRYRKLGYLRSTSEANKAVLNKLVSDSGDKKHDPNNQQVSITRDTLEKRAKDIGRDVIDADAIFQLLPDMELAEQVLVGSILSPKDMSSVELGFKLKEGMFDTEVVGDLLEVVRQYFKVDYKIDDRPDKILEDILFKKGAYIEIILPENSLDQLINGRLNISNEDYSRVINRLQTSRPLGFLGHPSRENVALESFNQQRQEELSKINVPVKKGDASRPFPYITVTDNFDTLKLPNYRGRKRSSAIGRALLRRQVSMESASQGLTPEQVERLYQKKHENQPVQTLAPSTYQERPSVGHPLVLTPPMESVIPVCIPGQPHEHVGYFILLDAMGRFVVRDAKRDYYGELRAGFQQGREDSSSDLLRFTREAFGGVTRSDTKDVDELHQAYTQIIENDLVNRLRNGIYGEEFSIGFTEEIYTLMLHRAMKAQKTQLLYVPAEFVVYYAFNYNSLGVGESLLKQGNIIANMRSILLFADTMAGVRSAIGRKKTNITIDRNDPDPQKTIGDIQSAVIEAAGRGFPLGSPDPAQTLDYLNRAGFDFAINVEGENYPSTRVEFDDYSNNVTGGNKELQDQLRRMQISGMGLNPEQIDPTQSPDFATSVVNNNLIMTRRVIRYQKLFCEFLSNSVRIYTTHSSVLREQLQKTLETQKGKLTTEQKKEIHGDLLERFIECIEVTLPSPDTSRIDQQLQAFEQYTSLLDRTLEAYINPDIFPEGYLVREPDAVTQVTAVIRAYYQRLWMEQNNVMPELFQLLEMETSRSPAFNLLDIQKSVQGSLGTAIQKYLDDLKKKSDKWKERYGETEDEFASTTDTFDDETETEDEFLDDISGDDDSDTLSDDDDLGDEDDTEVSSDDDEASLDDLDTPEEDDPKL